MNDISVILKLDEVATKLRDILEIPEEFIVNYDYLYEFINNVNKKFDTYKIELGHNMEFVLKDGKYITVIYENNIHKKEEIFEFVTRAFLYGFLLDKKTLNSYQLEEYYVGEEIILNDEYVDCLFKSFLLPRNQFYKELVKYSSGDGSSCNIDAMAKKLKNKHVYSRGHDLRVW